MEDRRLGLNSLVYSSTPSVGIYTPVKGMFASFRPPPAVGEEGAATPVFAGAPPFICCCPLGPSIAAGGNHLTSMRALGWTDDHRGFVTF